MQKRCIRRGVVGRLRVDGLRAKGPFRKPEIDQPEHVELLEQVQFICQLDGLSSIT